MSSKGQKFIKLEIPNKEVKYIFITKIKNWLDERIENENFDDMYNAMFEGDEKSLENEITDLLLDTISFHDSYENFYHGFLAGILAKLRSYNYKVKSNRENGMGRSDIIVQSTVKKGKAVIIEIKVAKDIKELEKKCNEALEQIEKNKYDIELIQYGYKDILKYGITFFKKKCMVKLKK